MSPVNSIHKKILIFAGTTALLFAGCGGSGAAKNQASGMKAAQAIAGEKYGEGSEVLPDSTGKFFLVRQWHKLSTLPSQQQVRFFIYDAPQQKIIFEDDIPGGTVFWKNGHQIKVDIIPGMLTSDPEQNRQLTGYIYDVGLRQKIPGGGG